jgi:hypothetical protein
MSIVYFVRATVTTVNDTGDQFVAPVVMAVEAPIRVGNSAEGVRMFEWVSGLVGGKVLSGRPDGEHVLDIDLHNISLL